MYSAVAAPYTIFLNHYYFDCNCTCMPYCPKHIYISVKFVVYLVRMKLLSELLSIRFLRSLANTTKLAQIVRPHSPTQQRTCLSLPSTKASTLQSRTATSDMSDTRAENDADKSLAPMKYFQSFFPPFLSFI
jgi:hypothetical protein